MWFKALIGFSEQSPEQVRQYISVEGKQLRSKVNGKTFTCGRFETPSLATLRSRLQESEYPKGRVNVREVVANVQQLHADKANANALFQVASQFNALEMMAPFITPEHGVDIYEEDYTQGPACAIAAGAGTIYRNYFVPVNGHIGQSAQNQIDCLKDLGNALGNIGNCLWEMRNGYSLASKEGLQQITHILQTATENEIDQLRQLLQVGIQWNTQVTLLKATHTVSQIYCSALPITYSRHQPKLWQAFAQLILEAAYEASLCAAALNAANNNSKQVFLTLLGGGAFGNKPEWIIHALRRALMLYQHADLDIAIVSHSSSNAQVQQLIATL